MKSPLFCHLLKHARAHRAALVIALARYQNAPSPAHAEVACAAFGALDCLYWQALGCDELLLAKKIARTLRGACRDEGGTLFLAVRAVAGPLTF